MKDRLVGLCKDSTSVFGMVKTDRVCNGCSFYMNSGRMCSKGDDIPSCMGTRFGSVIFKKLGVRHA